MNILLINHYAGSSSLGMEFRPYYFAREWEREGHNVLIVAASFSHVRNKAVEWTGRKKTERQVVDGVNYLWVKTPAYKGNGIDRVANMLLFCLRLLWHGRREVAAFSPDVVIASSTYTWDNWVAAYFARRHRAKYVFELHDVWPLSPMELGGMSRWHPFILALQWAEDFACRRADKVISLLPATQEHLVERGMAPDKFVYVPNGIVPEEWGMEWVDGRWRLLEGERDEASSATATARTPKTHGELGDEQAKEGDCCSDGAPLAHGNAIRELRRRKRLVVGYIGSHGVANALETFVEASAEQAVSDVGFVCVGQGPEKQQLEQRALELKSEIVFLPPVHKRSIPALMRSFDMLYIGLARCSLFRMGVSPNKLYEYMMSGAPIIFAIDSANDPVKESDSGFSVEPGNRAELTRAIQRMASLSVKERSQMGARGQRYVITNHLLPELAKKCLCYV
jgi:glycosyltransferase involved in cell wall biosynthesis